MAKSWQKALLFQRAEPSYGRDAPSHASLVLALLSFFGPGNLPGGLSLSDVDQSMRWNVFDMNTGALSPHVKDALIANAAWAAWRSRPQAQLACTLVLFRCEEQTPN
jgi:hypothetical protein